MRLFSAIAERLGHPARRWLASPPAIDHEAERAERRRLEERRDRIRRAILTAELRAHER